MGLIAAWGMAACGDDHDCDDGADAPIEAADASTDTGLWETFGGADTDDTAETEAGPEVDASAEIPELPQAVCPAIVCDLPEDGVIGPRTDVHCAIHPTDDAMGFHWSFTEPIGSGLVAKPSDFVTSIQFRPWVTGDYTVRVALETLDGEMPCDDQAVPFRVVSDEGFRVVLTWTTPTDPEVDLVGTDLDLHLRHQHATDWFDDPWDAYSRNASPNWAGNGPMDDPIFGLDDTDGEGPETFVLFTPEADRTYRVGVHYASARGFGESFATVQVFVAGALAGSCEGIRMVAHDLWDVGTIAWPSGDVVLVCDPPAITAGFPSPF